MECHSPGQMCRRQALQVALSETPDGGITISNDISTHSTDFSLHLPSTITLYTSTVGKVRILVWAARAAL